MHNTFFTILIAFLFTMDISAQFNTITRNQPLLSNQERKVKSNVEYVKESLTTDSIYTLSNEMQVKSSDSVSSPPRKEYKKARLMNGSLPRRRREKKEDNLSKIDDTADVVYAGRELTIPNLIRELKRNEILHPEIVLAQAILETGWFTSSVCRNKNNLFGLTNPRTGKYYEFNHWSESVRAYYSKVQYRYKGGNYLIWLRDIGYAEAPDYIQALIRIIRQLRSMGKNKERVGLSQVNPSF